MGRSCNGVVDVDSVYVVVYYGLRPNLGLYLEGHGLQGLWLDSCEL